MSNRYTRRSAFARLAGVSAAIGGAAYTRAQSHEAPKPVATSNMVFRKPPPANVVEHTRLGIHSIVALKDGTLLAPNGRRSTDGGKTWSEAAPFAGGAQGTGLVRLRSNAIALVNEGGSGGTLRISRDEAQTWGPLLSAFPKMINGPNFYSYGDAMIQHSTGRLIWSCSIDFNPKFNEFLYENVQSKGLWRGKPYSSEGHQHLPEIYMTLVNMSDDEGETWYLAQGYYKTPQALWGWFDENGIANGYRGHTSFGETTTAETPEGGVLMFGRSEVGRVVYSYSTDRGESWSVPLPTRLPSSGSPSRLRRIPSTGDLLCVWNQVSHEEIRRGYRRGRLSAAISKDGGLTWGNYKTLELSEGLDDVDRIDPEYPIAMVRARDVLGRFPDGFAYFHYANVNIIGDRVYLMYLRGSPLQGIAEQKLGEQSDVLRIYPLSYFYS